MLRALLTIVLLAVACSRPGEADRERFVKEFLNSVRDDTAFFRRYVSEPQKVVELKRRHPNALKGDLRIINREDYGDGSFDYGTECGVDLACIVYLTEKGGRVASADLAIVPRAR